MELFDIYPPHVRQEKIDAYKGRIAIIFPAALFGKIRGDYDILWENVNQISNGKVTKTAPDWVIEKAIKYFDKNEIDYEVFTI